MKTTLSKTWTSYLFCGLSAVILSWMLTGCRFGNHTVNAPPTAAYDGYDGFYDLNIKSLLFSVKLNGTSVPDANGSVNLLPTMLSSVLGEPVAFFHDPTSNQDVFANPATGGTQVLPTASTGTANGLGGISYQGQTATQTLWLDPACTEQLSVDEEGTYSEYSAPVTEAGLKVQGSISMNITVVTTFGGNCAASLAAMRTCLDDVTQCAGTDASTDQGNQTFVKSLLGAYLPAPSGLGIITEDQIQLLQSVSYTAKY